MLLNTSDPLHTISSIRCLRFAIMLSGVSRSHILPFMPSASSASRSMFADAFISLQYSSMLAAVAQIDIHSLAKSNENSGFICFARSYIKTASMAFASFRSSVTACTAARHSLSAKSSGVTIAKAVSMQLASISIAPTAEYSIVGSRFVKLIKLYSPALSCGLVNR